MRMKIKILLPHFLHRFSIQLVGMAWVLPANVHHSAFGAVEGNEPVLGPVDQSINASLKISDASHRAVELGVICKQFYAAQHLLGHVIHKQGEECRAKD